MGGSVWFYVAFMAVVVMIVLTVWAAMVLEAGQRPPGHGRRAATPGDEPGQTSAPERRAA
jgi:hypothetical protein